MGDGTSFQIGLGVQGTAAAVAGAASIEQLAAKLDIAGKAAESTATALKVAEGAYKSAETAANKAALAVEKVGLAAEEQRGKLAKALETGDTGSVERAKAKLAELTAREAELVQKASAAKAALSAQASALDKMRSGADAASKSEGELQKKLDAAKEAQAKASGSGKFNEAAEAIGKLGGPLGIIGQKAFGAAGGIGKMVSALGSAGPYVAIAVAVVALVAGVAALGAAAAATTVKIASWAVGLADVNRTQSLLAAGVARSVEGGQKLDATIDRLLTQVPATREELLQMAGGLADAGYRGDALSKALETAAVKAAKLKFGPDFGKQLLSLQSQADRFHANIGKTFGGLRIEGLLSQISYLVSLFDQSTSSGRAMKVVFESIFQPLIDGATELAPKIAGAFIQAEIWALKAAIAIKPYASKILLVAEAAGVLVAVLLVLGAVLVGLVIAPFVLIGALLTAIIAGILYFAEYTKQATDAAYEFWHALTDGVQGALSNIAAFDVGKFGSDIVTGIADGITAAGPAIVTALGTAVDSAIDAAKKKLKISSPSKLMHDEIGAQMAAGTAGGIDDEAPMVQTALEQMVSPPDVALPQGVPAAPSTSSAGATITIGEMHFHGKDGEDEADQFLAFLERLGVKIGLGRPEPAT